MGYTKKDIQAGQILLSEPYMIDSHFKRSVVLLCDHGQKEGTVGFILNRPTKYFINESLEGFPDIKSRIYYGGPVDQDTLHYLHNVGDLLDGSKKVSNGIYWGGNFEKLQFLIENELIQPHQIRFYVGYSGWEEDQLAAELDEGSWVQSKADANYVFNTRAEYLWSKAMKHLGGNHAVISQIPDHQNSN